MKSLRQSLVFEEIPRLIFQSHTQSPFTEKNSDTLAGLIDGTEYDKSIGTKSTNGFRWHTENGFRSLESVERFLSQNQGYEIQDEYSKTLSLEQLRKLSNA